MEHSVSRQSRPSEQLGNPQATDKQEQSIGYDGEDHLLEEQGKVEAPALG